MENAEPQGPISAVKDTPVETPAPEGDTGTPQQAPNTPEEGQPQGDSKGEVGASAKDTPKEPTEVLEFFDPKEVPEELKPAYKNMQAAFTKKTQAIAADRDKVEAYKAFMADPVGQLKALASEYGFSLSPSAGTQQPNAQPQGNSAWAPDSGQEPQSWHDVIGYLQNQVLGQVQSQFAPTVQSVQKMTASNIEKQLDGIDADWRLYEDDMRQTMKQHPTLIKDVGLLYRMSVPAEVSQARATQAALKKLENKAKSSKMHGGEKTPKTVTQPKQASNFQEAVAAAKTALARGN